jgi:hypothetical protein
MKYALRLLLVLLMIQQSNNSLQAQYSTLFESDEIIEITLFGKINELFNDRADNPNYHNITLSYKTPGGQEIKSAINAKTRGHFRKNSLNCSMPPILLNFSNAQLPTDSPFKGQEKLKLVTPCQDDRYVLREYFTYKIYNLFTEKSFRNRLVKVTFMEEGKETKAKTVYCFLIEDEHAMAKRNGLDLLEKDLIRPEKTERETFLDMALFELLIANTDWSVQYRQNVKLLGKENNPVIYAVPYDFDHSGLVAAPYAKPAEALEMTSVRERRYRGYCLRDLSAFQSAIERQLQLKEKVLGIYTNNTLLDPKYAAATTKYLEEFYDILNNEKKRSAVLGYPCREDGTGNVVIKGLRQ